MLKRYITILSLIISNCVWAQNQVFLSGKVTDKTNTPLQSTVITYKQESPKKELTVVADNKGNFKVPVNNSNAYTIQAALLGYKPYFRTFNKLTDTLQIVLDLEPKSLGEVKVIAKKPVIEQKIDRLIYNVENSITSKGSSAWNVLDKAPGVSTNFDNGVSLNGKNSSIYINGRASRLSGSDLSNYLKNLSADNVSRIELMTNPPAEFDAQGGSVINIIIKKKQGNGIENSVNTGYTQGRYSKYNIGDVFNFRSGPINLYGNYSFRTGKTGKIEDEYIIFSSPTNYSDWRNIKNGFSGSDSHSYELGLDYNLNKNHILGILIDGYNTVFNRPNSIITSIYNNHQAGPDSILNTTNLTHGNTSLYTVNLNYRGQLDSVGQTISLDFDYTPYRNSNEQSFLNNTLIGDIVSNQQSANSLAKQHIDIIAAKIDYSKPINKIWSLSAGLKFSSIINNNSLSYFDLINSSFINNSTRSNDFNYNEKTFAEYVKASGKIGKFSLQLGLRGENTTTEGNSVTLASINNNRYFKIFPSIFLIYNINANNSINGFYGYRISRPEYWRLNPFKYYSSPYTYIEGNPYLRPAYNTTWELGYTYKRKYSLTTFYYHTDNVFSNITAQDNINKIFFDTQRNLSKSVQAGLYGSFPILITSWWDMSNYVRLTYRNEASNYLQGNYNYHLISYYLNSSNEFTISKKHQITAEVNAWYYSPSIQGIYNQRSRSNVSAGISKTLFSGDGTVRLSANDIFYGNRYIINVQYLDQTNGFIEKDDTRTCALTFSYKFGNKKLKQARKRSTSSEDEKNRTYN